MKYNPEIHHRRWVRLKGYDYSNDGLYFITICTKNRECFFGKIENNDMIPNDIGNMANQFWMEIPEHFKNIVLHRYIVMPNHIHGIIEISGNSVVGTRHVVSLQQNSPATTGTVFGKPVAGSVSVIIQQYKSSVKRWCNKNRYEYFQWQSRFHDHIIRNEQSYRTITEYIINNPANWNEDKFFNE